MSHINGEQWDQMTELLDDDFVGLVQAFVADSRQRITLIKEAHREGDDSTGLELSHVLQGASANIGAVKLAKHCSTMQITCQAKMIAHAHNVVNDIETEFNQVVTEINNRLEQYNR